MFHGLSDWLYHVMVKAGISPKYLYVALMLGIGPYMFRTLKSWRSSSTVRKCYAIGYLIGIALCIELLLLPGN